MIPGLGRSPWRRERLPTPVFWPGEFHGLYNPWVANSQTQLSDSHFLSLSAIYLEIFLSQLSIRRRQRQPIPVLLPGNPMDGGAW